MLDITFRTDELTAREMHMGINSDPLSQIEFILLRAAPLALSVDDLTKELWRQPASHVSALASAALVAATEATKAAMERVHGVTTAPAQRPSGESLADSVRIFDEAAVDGLEM